MAQTRKGFGEETATKPSRTCLGGFVAVCCSPIEALEIAQPTTPLDLKIKEKTWNTVYRLQGLGDWRSKDSGHTRVKLFRNEPFKAG